MHPIHCEPREIATPQMINPHNFARAALLSLRAKYEASFNVRYRCNN